MANALPGSPPSSPKVTRTDRPLIPPRALTAPTQARMATGIAASWAPIGPDAVPNEPRRISPPGAGGGAAGPDPGADGEPPAPGAAAPGPPVGRPAPLPVLPPPAEPAALAPEAV